MSIISIEILDVGSGIIGEGNIRLEGGNIFHVDVDRRAFHVEVICDIHHLPFIDCCFGVVYAGHVLEHVDSPSKAVEELKRISKKWVIVKVPNASWYKFMTDPEETPDHIYSWNSWTFRNLMRKYFLHVEIKSTIRRLANQKQSKIRTLKLMLLIPLISTNELTAYCKKQ